MGTETVPSGTKGLLRRDYDEDAMTLRPEMIAATVGVKGLPKVALNAAGALKGALCGS
jgi:hypothetical protein